MALAGQERLETDYSFSKRLKPCRKFQPLRQNGDTSSLKTAMNNTPLTLASHTAWCLCLIMLQFPDVPMAALMPIR